MRGRDGVMHMWRGAVGPTCQRGPYWLSKLGQGFASRGCVQQLEALGEQTAGAALAAPFSLEALCSAEADCRGCWAVQPIGAFHCMWCHGPSWGR